MINGLDLFSGIGGISIALNEWVRPIAYCEIDPYCQGVLLSRMSMGQVKKAPIWDDIRTLDGKEFWGVADIIHGGFPCQDISIAGLGKGLEGERSGLFFEIVRLAQEIKPKFIFLENVPAITSRGGLRVVREITEMGYDCRWCVISAASIGAPHKRERLFCLARHTDSNNKSQVEELENSIPEIADSGGVHKIANTNNNGQPASTVNRSPAEGIPNTQERADISMQPQGMDSSRDVADTRCFCAGMSEEDRRDYYDDPEWASFHDPRCGRFWEAEPNVGRVVNGLSQRVDRIRALGNSVVPEQAKKAFKILMGLGA